MTHLHAVHAPALGRPSQRSLEELSPQLNIIFGPNGSGKSTLRDAAYFTLYGIPTAGDARTKLSPSSALRREYGKGASLRHVGVELRDGQRPIAFERQTTSRSQSTGMPSVTQGTAEDYERYIGTVSKDHYATIWMSSHALLSEVDPSGSESGSVTTLLAQQYQTKVDPETAESRLGAVQRGLRTGADGIKKRGERLTQLRAELSAAKAAARDASALSERIESLSQQLAEVDAALEAASVTTEDIRSSRETFRSLSGDLAEAKRQVAEIIEELDPLRTAADGAPDSSETILAVRPTIDRLHAMRSSIDRARIQVAELEVTLTGLKRSEADYENIPRFESEQDISAAEGRLATVTERYRAAELQALTARHDAAGAAAASYAPESSVRIPVAGAVLALVLAVALVALTAESITVVHLLLALGLGATVGSGLWLVMRSQPKAGSSLPNFSADADRADAALHAALGTWREVLDSIPEFSSVKDVSPDSVPGLLSGARTYLGIRRECTRTAELLDGYRAQIRQWEDDVRSTTAAAAPTLSASLPDPTDAIQALHDIAETTHENFRTAESHKRQLASLEARLSLAESRCADAERHISSLAKHYGLEPGAVDQVLTARLGALTQEVQTLHDTRSELVAERASLRAKQDQYEQDASVEQLEAELDALSGELAALVEADAIAELARSILSGASQQYEKESTPTIMRLTSEVLGALTDGALNHVELLTTNAGRVLSVSGSRGSGLTIMELSDGERDQLYLAFRIGVLLSLDDIGPDLPVLLDDVILTYDAERRERACAAIAELAKHRQVLFFTSQDSIKECLEAHGRDAGVSTHTIALQVS